MNNILSLFCNLDDFCKWFIPLWEQSLLEENKNYKKREVTMSPAEVMSLLILFHQSDFRHFKTFYTQYVPLVLARDFPKRVSYQRFVELAQSVMIPLSAYLHRRRSKSSGVAFIDSTPLRVCTNRRIPRHKTFAEYAQRGKSSVDWYYGFKLHLVIDDKGELISFFISAANFDDRKALTEMSKFIQGKLYADKGYISKALKQSLKEQRIELITPVRKNMKKEALSDFDRVMLRKRSLIETVFGQLKQITQIEHSRHRSLLGFMVNVLAGLIAYSWKANKPSLNLRLNPDVGDLPVQHNPSQTVIF